MSDGEAPWAGLMLTEAESMAPRSKPMDVETKSIVPESESITLWTGLISM
jgi:hypothetical protein